MSCDNTLWTFGWGEPSKSGPLSHSSHTWGLGKAEGWQWSVLQSTHSCKSQSRTSALLPAGLCWPGLVPAPYRPPRLLWNSSVCLPFWPQGRPPCICMQKRKALERNHKVLSWLLALLPALRLSFLTEKSLSRPGEAAAGLRNNNTGQDQPTRTACWVRCLFCLVQAVNLQIKSTQSTLY